MTRKTCISDARLDLDREVTAPGVMRNHVASHRALLEIGTMTRSALSIAAIVIAACGSSGGDDNTDPGNDGHEQLVAPLDLGNDGHEQLVPPLEGMEQQGRFLLGDALDALDREPGYHLSMTTAAVDPGGDPLTVTFDGSASLRAGWHLGADPFFDGVVLFGPEGGLLRLTVARGLDHEVKGGYDVAFYNLAVRRTSADPWVDPCLGGDAIPLAGTWQRSGFHEHDPRRISFACAGSVAYKCTVWGYLAGGDDTSLGWRAHQACTRMARADYCANGESHTREGTVIRIFDFAGVTSPPPHRFGGVLGWPPDPNRGFFEAAWNDGARPASCLSRLRWQSLPIGPLCDNGELPDPRRDTSVKFCEDLEWPDPGSEPTGALLFNQSAYTDLALHIWQNDSDHVSTVRGYYEPPTIAEPFPTIGSYTQVAPDAPDALLVRSMRAEVDPADYEEVGVYAKPGDLVVAGVSQPPPPPFTRINNSHEGYVRKSQPPSTVPFKLYRHATTGDYLSTALSPPPGYELQWTIGYTLPPEPR